MLALDKTLKLIAAQLRGFSSTAKLLVGALMVILVMSLLFVAIFAGRANMVPLGLGPGVSEEVRTQAVSYLDSRSIPWAEDGRGIVVPVDQKYAVLAQLTENNLISPDQIDFMTLWKDDSPFTDRRTREARYLVAKMIEVERMISALDGIVRAKVVIDQPKRSAGIGTARIPATASVIVEARGQDLTRGQADAIARIVAGAHAPLKVGDVTVVDARSNRAVAARTDEDLSSTRYLETKEAVEKQAKRKIEDALSVYPGVIVAVHAPVDATEVDQWGRTFEDPKSGLTREEIEEREATDSRTRGEPGVRPNVRASIVAPPGSSSRLTQNRSESEMENAFPRTETHTRDSRGYPRQINASILLPKSYFLGLYRDEQGDAAADPDPAALDAVVARETEKIRGLIEPLIDMRSVPGAMPGTVVVSMYADLANMGTGGIGGGGGSIAGDAFGGGLAGESVIRSVGLGALALVSLALMFMMVRKASRVEEMPSAEELVGIPPALAEADADVVGEVDETTAAMEGLEIEEGAVRRQQMVDQINELAANASDEAATLLRKWIKTDD